MVVEHDDIKPYELIWFSTCDHESIRSLIVERTLFFSSAISSNPQGVRYKHKLALGGLSAASPGALGLPTFQMFTLLSSPPVARTWPDFSPSRAQ